MAHALFEPLAFVDPPPPENFMRVQLVPKNKIGNFLSPFFTIQFIKIQDCVICILQVALAWHASDSFPEISTVGRTRTVIYVYIRLIDTPFYYFILKIIKKHQPFSAVTRITYIPVTLLQVAQ